MSDDIRKSPNATDVRDTRGRFAPGNPGRQRGARNRVTRAAEALLGRDTAALTEKAIEFAMASDANAHRLCLERLIPPARERPLDIDRLSDDPAAAMGEIIQAVAEGDLLPSEGERLAALVKVKAEMSTLREIEERLAALETTSTAGSRPWRPGPSWLASIAVWIASGRLLKEGVAECRLWWFVVLRQRWQRCAVRTVETAT